MSENIFSEFIGESSEILEIKRFINKIAPTDLNILLQGETGTGKNLVAEIIHKLSRRNKGNLSIINCASIPAQLLESELFGHEKGAFTSAYVTKKGKLELADKGTLCLDEIGEMPLEMQAKILHAIEYKKFERVGGVKEIGSDFRLVSATNASLVNLMKKGTFRTDLFYRIKGASIYLPPLRERRDDIKIIAKNFFKSYGRKFNKKTMKINRKVWDVLENYNWPGNIRELQRSIEVAVIMSENDEILPEHFPSLSVSEMKETLKEFYFKDDMESEFKEFVSNILKKYKFYYDGTLYENFIESFEKQLISQVMNENSNNKLKVAKILGLARNTLKAKINKLIGGT